MNRAKVLGASIALGALSFTALNPAMAERSVPLRDASIPFADHGGIWDWEADRDRGLWVQSSNRQWYYTSFMGPCVGIDFAHTIAFDTSPLGSLDRWSSVLVPRWGKCTFSSFEPSDGPPTKRRKADTAL